MISGPLSFGAYAQL